MRRAVPSVIFAALLIGAVVRPAWPAADALALWRENRRLEAEAVLAATPKPYFELDLERRRILLKTRGMTLVELPVHEQSIWGRRMAVGPTVVEKRDALVRPTVRPGEETPQESLDDQLLELNDMPAAYRMMLTGDVEVEILPLATGRWPVWQQRAHLWRWRLSRPLATLRQRRERHETVSVLLVMKPGDAQRLYWSLFEGLEGILIPP